MSLCYRKFELILTEIFRIMAILKKCSKFSEKANKTIAFEIFQKMAPKLPPIFIIFSDTYWCPYAIMYVYSTLINCVYYYYYRYYV